MHTSNIGRRTNTEAFVSPSAETVPEMPEARPPPSKLDADVARLAEAVATLSLRVDELAKQNVVLRRELEAARAPSAGREFRAPYSSTTPTSETVYVPPPQRRSSKPRA